MGLDRNNMPHQCRDDAVCIQGEKVFDVCKDKECLEDLRVFFSPGDQSTIDHATSVKFRKAEIIWVTTDVEPVPFNRGYYGVDINFYFKIFIEASCGMSKSVYMEGLATYTKKVILFGSEGSAYIFSSQYIPNSSDLILPRSTNLPKAVVEVVDPVALNVKLVDVCDCNCKCDSGCDNDGDNAGGVKSIPEIISGLFEGGICPPRDENKRVYVTLGIFVIARLQRSVQLLVPCMDYCIPDKDCVSGTDDDPCALFEKIKFPFEEFYPPRPDCNC